MEACKAKFRKEDAIRAAKEAYTAALGAGSDLKAAEAAAKDLYPSIDPLVLHKWTPEYQEDKAKAKRDRQVRVPLCSPLQRDPTS